jgi:hypothetical protein
MAKYIDAEKIVYHEHTVCAGHGDDYTVKTVTEEAISAMPAADVVEVRHGHWIYCRDADGFKRCKCSECIISYGCIDTPYCPNCGAKMDGKGEDE